MSTLIADRQEILDFISILNKSIKQLNLRLAIEFNDEYDNVDVTVFSGPLPIFYGYLNKEKKSSEILLILTGVLFLFTNFNLSTHADQFNHFFEDTDNDLFQSNEVNYPTA